MRVLEKIDASSKGLTKAKVMKELFTEVWTRLKELRKAGEAQGNKFSGFCGVLSSLTIYTFYYYL